MPPTDRGRYFTLDQVEASERYGGVFTVRLLRRLIADRRMPHSRAGRRVIVCESDLDAYLAAQRREAKRGPLSRSA